MNNPKITENARVHETVWREIRAIAIGNKTLATQIIQRIAELGLDPLPKNQDCNSKFVENLARGRINVRRLRCFDIKDYRIFYSVKKIGLVCVYALVYATGRKHDEAYDENSDHYQLIKLLYKFWRECQ